MPERYMSGFGNEFESEAAPGALPKGQNAPQRCPYGLYAEQLSGTAYTAPRGVSRRSWLYRIRPSVLHARRFVKMGETLWKSAPGCRSFPSLGQFRWGPPPFPNEELTFIAGVRTMTTAGDADAQSGVSANLYFVNKAMVDASFYDADGELLVVPQEGGLSFFTEFGRIEVSPGEICVLPRGIKFKAAPLDGPGRGFLCENYGAHFTLPHRGAIGANGLADARDFLTPVAAFEEKEGPATMTVKWGGVFYICEIDHSPLDVVAWHGNYAPYKYDLSRFAPLGALLFDHPDPSIFTVLTSPSGEEGVANADFVIFPERWQVAEHSFRPPWHHVNVMSEFMGLVRGRYDAKRAGFAPGGMSLHNAMSPHGPDAESYFRALNAELKPEKLVDTLAFMFETRLPQHLTRYAATLETLQQDYAECWSGLRKRFNGTP